MDCARHLSRAKHAAERIEQQADADAGAEHDRHAALGQHDSEPPPGIAELARIG